MKPFGWILILGVPVLLSACRHDDTHTLPIAKTDTIKDIMDAHVDPAGDTLFASVQEISDSQGIRQWSPSTPAEWAEVRHQFTVLMQATDYLVMAGRKAARPTDKVAFPDVESGPTEVQALIDNNHDDFVKRAMALKQASQLGIAAVQAKDTDALWVSLRQVDRACESCHLHYYYPKDKRAHQAAKEDGVPD